MWVIPGFKPGYEESHSLIGGLDLVSMCVYVTQMWILVGNSRNGTSLLTLEMLKYTAKV